MTVLNRQQRPPDASFPGVDRSIHLNGEMGADSLSVMDLTMAAESRVPTHTHPTEEAMVILEGHLEAILADDVVTVKPGQTVLAPAGVKHGFVNKSGAPARLIAIFPTATVERTMVD